MLSSGGRRLSRRMARAAAVAWHQRQSLSRSISGTSLHSWSIRSLTSSMLAARSSVQSIASKVRSPTPGRGSIATSPRVRPALRMLDRWRSPWSSPAGPPLANSRAFRCPSARIRGVTSGLIRGLLSSPPMNTRDPLPDKALSSSRCQRRQYRPTILGSAAHQASTPGPNRVISRSRLSSSSTKFGSSMRLSRWEAPVCATGNGASHSWMVR